MKIMDLEPAKRLEAIQRLKAIKEGRMRLPGLRCGFCRGTILAHDPRDRDILVCGSCGRRTPKDDAHIVRQREIEAIILNGPVEP